MILLHYLTRLFYLLPILSRAKMAKKGRLALSRRPLSRLSCKCRTGRNLPQLTYL